MVKKMRLLNLSSIISTKFKKWYLLVGFLNFFVNLIIFCVIEKPFYALLFGPILFWGILIFFPNTIDYKSLISPRNYVFVLFFITVVISPPILLLNGSILTNWILDYNPKYWNYFDITMFYWVLSFFSYSIAIFKFENSDLKKNTQNHSFSLNVYPQNWMLFSGIILILIGVIGLILGAGSISTLFAIRGQRELALQIINVPGNGRYIVWYSCIPYGACLLWFYCIQKFKLGKVQAFFLLLILYIPFIPFYSFTSGRGTTIMPLVMLIALYYRFSYKIPLNFFLIAFNLLLVLFGFWSLYRQDGLEFNTDKTIFKMGIQVLMDSFSRLDVSIAAIAGFHEGNLSLLWGKTLIAAITHPIPAWIIDLSNEGGTMALAKAVFSDNSWDEPTGMASPLMIEGFLNFGIFGIIIFMFFLGKATLLVEKLFNSDKIIVSIFGLALIFQLPFGAAMQVIVAGAFWTVIFPFLISYIFYYIFK